MGSMAGQVLVASRATHSCPGFRKPKVHWPTLTSAKLFSAIVTFRTETLPESGRPVAHGLGEARYCMPSDGSAHGFLAGRRAAAASMDEPIISRSDVRAARSMACR